MKKYSQVPWFLIVCLGGTYLLSCNNLETTSGISSDSSKKSSNHPSALLEKSLDEALDTLMLLPEQRTSLHQKQLYKLIFKFYLLEGKLTLIVWAAKEKNQSINTNFEILKFGNASQARLKNDLIIGDLQLSKKNNSGRRYLDEVFGRPTNDTILLAPQVIGTSLRYRLLRRTTEGVDKILKWTPMNIDLDPSPPADAE